MQMKSDSTHEITLTETEAIIIADEINSLVLEKQLCSEDYLCQLGKEIRRNLDLHNAAIQMYVNSFTQLE